jgi:hypothetical protein
MKTENLSPAMRISILSFIPIVALLLNGCGAHEHDHAHHGHDGHGDHGHRAHAHEHVAPHGGTAVVLGDETFHLEFVRDAETGTLDAYVLDGHLENFIRVTNTAFSIEVKGGQTLVFNAQTNAATGESLGDSSYFLAQADWLRTTSNFQAVIPALQIRGSSFTNVSFSFPEGNE